MVVSSGFLGHVLVSDRSEDFLRSNGLITAAQPLNNTLNRQQQNQQPQQQQSPSLQQSIMQPSANVKINNNAPPPARVILICHSNSHPFQKRNIPLEARQEIKVGRSVPRSRVEENNAIFDCKVLSRNHALIWYSDGKFLIKDTGSSNGTFINSQRIKSNEAYEISSGDVVQFGVDVIENSRKETHGCIIAVLKLIAPDGMEKTSFQQLANPSGVGGGGTGSFDNDLFRLKQIMHESYLHEILLEEKLVNLQKEVLATWKNSSNTWQAMIHEDLLLSRIDILENKLSCYQKNITNEKLQEQIDKLQDEKEIYQKTAKEALKKVYQDRLAVIQKFTKFEQFWQASEDELMMLRAQLADSKENNDKLLLQEMNHSNNESIREQIAKQQADCKAIKESFEATLRETDELKSQLQIIDDFNDNDILTTEHSIGNDKNRNSTVWNKQQEIMQWLNNSDLKQLKDSDDIIHAMCNESKHRGLKIDPHQCMKLYDKLLDIEKRFSTSSVKSTTTTTTTTTLDNKHSIDSDAIIISDESESKTDKASDDSNHNNTENGESKVIDEIESKENNANGVVVVVKEENQNTVDIYNDNIDDDDDNEKNMKIFRNVIGELKGVYNEFLAQMKLVQKDLIRAAKYDELESKLISTMLELQSLQKDHQRREQLLKMQNDDHTMNTMMTIGKKTSFITNNDRRSQSTDELINDTDFILDDDSTVADDIIVVSSDLTHNDSTLDNSSASQITLTLKQNDTDDNFDTNSISTLEDANYSSTNSIITEINNEINLDDVSEQSAMSLASDDESFSTQVVRVETLKPDDDLESKEESNEPSSMATIQAINETNVDDDYFDEKEALESFDRIIEEESKLINETDILREEELIELKERCIKLNDDNIALRREVDNLRLTSNKQFQLLLYTASLAAFIGYLLSFFFS